MMKNAVILLLAGGLLAGCGFHLPGNYEIPPFLREITVRTPVGSKDLDTEMRLALERSNILPDGGEVLLDIISEQLTRQASTMDSHAKAAEYTLVYTVEYRVGRSDGKALAPRQTLILRRSYQYNTASVVGKSTEEETLVHELRVDAAQQIVRQLSTLKTPPAPPADAAATP
jgi:LPS-assembly lipoprotein